MNLSLVKAVYCDSQGNEYFFDNMFVQARNIRYVHIPETVSTNTILSPILECSYCNIYISSLDIHLRKS